MRQIFLQKAKDIAIRSGLAILLFSPVLLYAQATDLTGAWTNIGSGQWQSTTANGVTVTASATTTSPADWADVGTGQMTPNDVGTNVFTNADVYGRSSLTAAYYWDIFPETPTDDIDIPGDDQGTGTITFTFSQPVQNPVLFVDRIGGSSGNISNSAQLSLDGGFSWAQLAGVGHFDATTSTLQRTPDLATSTPSSAECASSNTLGTACGTVQIDGTLSSFSLTWIGVGVEGGGGDEIEFVLEAPRAPSLSIAKTGVVSGTGPASGDTVSYTVVVENTGTVDASVVTLTDMLPTGVTYVSGSSEMTYPVDVAGSYTSPNLGPVNVNGNGTTTISFDTSGVLPAGATLTSYSLSASGTSSGFSWNSEIDLQATYPGGTAYDLDFGDDLGLPASPGAYSVNQGPIGVGGTAIGLYQFIWSEDFNDGGVDNVVANATFTIEYKSGRTTTTEAASTPPGLVVDADAITLQPGETLTVTYDVTIDAGATGSLTNTATANADGLPTPVSDSYTIVPTAATIGEVGLEAKSVEEFLAELDVDGMDAGALLALLETWDPEMAVAGADRAAILAALRDFLDPDGDGHVAVLRWDTLAQSGTIGFFVERSANAGDWFQINADLLPSMIDAPHGAEYLLADPEAQSGIDYFYRLIEQEAWGTRRAYGPYRLRME